ncbi:DUF2955 domain-containing protein [Roseibium sp.]|uniref:DUF2955 domain-containing protein n=1 Tax=Roseibium sp. TaxID=1936156 RepID=UPI003BAC1493
MPTEAAKEDPRSEAWKTDRDERHLSFRIASAAALAFVVGMFFSWPLFYIAAAFAAPFAQAPAPMSFRAGVRLLASMAALLGAALLLSSVLLPYPIVYLSAIVIALVLSFRYAVRGGDMLVTIAALLGSLLVPHLMLMSPQLGVTVTFWLMANFTIGLVVSWVAFILFPGAPSGQTPKSDPKENNGDLDRRLVRICLVCAPFAVFYFISGSDAFYALIFVALLSSQLAATTDAGPAAARTMLMANLSGGLAAIIAYEVIVMAPLPLAAILVVATLCLFFANRIATGDPQAASALTVAILLLGGSMVFANDADVRLIDRMAQIALAIGYILAAFVLVDRWLPERSQTNGQVRDDVPIS